MKKLVKLFSIGDLVTLKRSVVQLQGSYMEAKLWMIVLVVAIMLRMLKNNLISLTIRLMFTLIATVQEEVGIRGATTSTYGMSSRYWYCYRRWPWGYARSSRTSKPLN